MKAYLPNNPSSNIYRVSHTGLRGSNESKEGDLIVVMKGGTYLYLGVPIEHMVEMLRAESSGKYLNSVIKPAYGYRIATGEEARALADAEPGVMSDWEHARLFPNSDEARDLSLNQTIETGKIGYGDAYIETGEAEADDAYILAPLNNWGPPIDIKFLDPNVKVKYAKAGDAAFDLMASSAENLLYKRDASFPLVVMPGEHILIGTGIAMKLHPGLAGFVLPRSGLAKKCRVSVVNTPGLIDSGYTGEIGVLFENRGDEPFEIKQYDRIAQYMIVPAITPVFRIVTDLEQTERGDAGFGSTGVAKSDGVVV